MACCLYTPVSICGFSGRSQRKCFSNERLSFQRFNVFSASKCKATTENSGEINIQRRSANYHPSIWDYDYIQSLKSDSLQDESYKERASKLQGEVKMMLDNVENPLEKLELIDTLQRLGLSHHFEEEINEALKNISSNGSNVAWKKDNLYATALEFRLLRQHGHKVNQDVFTSFMDEAGNIKASLSRDFAGLLSLYESSYLGVEGETMLENARVFAAKHAKHLEECLKQNDDRYLSMLADHALELPLHWRMSRLEARWFIDVYEKHKDKNPIVLELAILDYNMVQAIHQEDLRSASVWDINAIQCLPNYMKMCYHALHNSINDMAFDCLKEQGRDVIPFLKKLWSKLCKAFLLEAQWYHTGYTPTLQEYIDNAWISIAGLVMLGHAYLVTDHITDDGLQTIQEFYPNIIRWSSTIVRLANDLATSSYELQRGDVTKSIRCYMHESGSSEEEAREHVKKLIDATWKKMNEAVLGKSPFSRKFIEIANNLARLSLLMYRTGDGLGIEDEETKDRVLLLFVNSISIFKVSS